MRNPLARFVHRDPAKPTLRDRLTATKAKAKRVVAMNRVMLKTEPKVAAEPDRIALVNYASWLFMERRMICRELYPDKGHKAERFVLALNAADRFHFPGDEKFPSGEPSAWKASDRAVKVLDLVGCDWRSDLNESGRAHLDPASMQDSGKRPTVPFGWPALDAELVTALADLRRLDAAIDDLLMGLPARRHPENVPGYLELTERRDDVLSTLVRERAESLAGLQAKANALLSKPVLDNHEEVAEVGRSLARDIIGTSQSGIEPRPDPIMAEIKESRRLQSACIEASKLPQPVGSFAPLLEQDAALAAFTDHCDDVLLKTVPRTAAGCAALSRYALDHERDRGFPLDEDEHGSRGLRILGLIARSPLL